MKKKTTCRECGCEQNYEINGSGLFMSAVIGGIMYFTISIQIGLILGLMFGVELYASLWKTLFGTLIIISLILTIKIKDYTKSEEELTSNP